MTRTDVERLVGTVLMVLGIGVCAYAGVVGVFAVGAEAFGVDRHSVVFLAVTAICWAVVGLYHFCWGYRIRENFQWP